MLKTAAGNGILEYIKELLRGCDREYEALEQACLSAARGLGGLEEMLALKDRQITGDLWFAEKLVKYGAKCKVAPTVNPGFCIGHFTGACAHPVDADAVAHMTRTDNAYRALGAVLSYNCTPYIATNVPNFGEVCAFSESSATPYVNAVCFLLV
jgi:hypothetical protein